MRRVCVYLSSSSGRATEVAAIEALGHAIAARDLTLVYGGAHRGLMGVLADTVLGDGGTAIGVIPQALVDFEVAHTGLSEQHVVTTMHERKAKMAALADGFIVAPGGFGTLEEAFEQLTEIQLGYHHKPLVFLEIDGFWGRLAGFLDHAAAIGVLRPEMRALFQIAPDPGAALDALARSSAQAAPRG